MDSLTYLQKVKQNLDLIIASYNFQTYKFYIYALVVLTILYVTSSLFKFFTKLPFLLGASLFVASYLSK